MSLSTVLRVLKEYIIISIGMLIYSFAWTTFLIPLGIAGGGSSGIAAVIHFATNGVVPVSVAYLGINAILLGLGTLVLGKSFGFKTIYSILLASIFFQFLPEIIPYVSEITEPFINAIIGGTLSAVGIYFVLNQGGSTGGTDIIALIITKYHNVGIGRIYLICDLIIVSSIIFLPDKSLPDVVYGYLQMISFSFAVDMLLTGNKQSIQLFIFTSKLEELANVLNENNTGVTVINSTGWYTKQENNILIVVVRKNKLSEITKLIKSADSTAFITVTPVMSVYGRGFEQIKEGKITWKKKN